MRLYGKYGRMVACVLAAAMLIGGMHGGVMPGSIYAGTK